MKTLRIKKSDLSEIAEKELYTILINNLQNYSVEYNINRYLLSNNLFCRLTYKRVSVNEFKMKGDYKALGFILIISMLVVGFFLHSLLFGLALTMLGNVFVWYYFQKHMERDVVHLFNSMDAWSINTKPRIEY